MQWTKKPDWETQLKDILGTKQEVSLLNRVIIGGQIPRGSRFVSGQYYYLLFDGQSASGTGMGGCVILDPNGQEVVRAGKFFGEASLITKPKIWPYMRD